VRIVLPAFCIASGPLMGIVRQTRSAVLEVVGQDYVRTARAKGLRGWTVVWRHVFRNALTPLLTIGVRLFGGILQGSIFVERVFNIPGYGALNFQSFVARDFPVILAVTVISAVIAMTLNLLVDLMYGVADPRVRLGRRAEELES
jgi:peptide/nickel transport system permease protein